MTLLIIYILFAVGFSFLCSVAEAVLLSVNHAHIALLEKDGKKGGKLLGDLKQDVSKPLAAILTLNTIAHTIGAAGAGAQAAVVFGNAYLGVASAVLTLIILVFSEIIPKTLGAHYWKPLSVPTAYFLKYLVLLLYPFVKLSELLTSSLKGDEPTLAGFSREEFAVMAELSSEEGQLAEQEINIMKNLMVFHDLTVRNAMTPRIVVFSLPSTLTVDEYFHKYDQEPFSRIPIYDQESDNVSGFVLKTDLLLAKARGNDQSKLENYKRQLVTIPESKPMNQAFNELVTSRTHMMMIVDEYGSFEGILTLEDLLETLLGLEIVDEKDKNIDMQAEAAKLWKKRLKERGVFLDDDEITEVEEKKS